jgi:Holliday junction resolvasome RuvABC DNA-binding subunit
LGIQSVVKGLFKGLWDFGKRTASNAASHALGEATSIMYRPAMRTLLYRQNLLHPTEKMGINEYLEGYARGFLSKAYVTNELKELGFDDAKIGAFFKIGKKYLDVSGIQALYNKGKIDLETATTRLKNIGFDASEAGEILEIGKVLMGAADIQELYRRGEITQTQAKSLLGEIGFKADAQNNIISLSTRIMGATEVQGLFIRGEISEAEAKNRLAKLGYEAKEQGEILLLGERLQETADLQRLFIRGDISEVDAVSRLKSLGFDETSAKEILLLGKQFLGAGEIQQLYLREEITIDEAKARLSKLGFEEQEQDEIITLAAYIPPVPDFIRMAVREVFSPEIVEKYGLFQDYPPDLDRFAKMSGLDPEFAKFYWGAHWVLPSMTQAFDMFHRDIISYDDLTELLRSLDVMPFWRDKLILLSETPFTRVDVRRMYQLGVLSYEEMVRAYRDIGYSLEKATRLAEFTAADINEPNRELTKAEVLRGYRSGLFSQIEAINALTALGYERSESDYYIAFEDYKRNQSKANTFVKAVQKQYRYGNLSKNDVVVKLSEFGIPDREITNFIEIWDIENTDKPLQPTKAELRRFLKRGIIDDETFRKALSDMGYADIYVEQYFLDAIYPKKKLPPGK